MAKASKTDEAIAQTAGSIAGVLIALYALSWLFEQLYNQL